MPYKKKTDLDSAKDLSPEDKADLSALFDSAEANEKEIRKLRAQKEDADKVVSRAADLEKLLKEKETLSKELQEKLNKLTVNAPIAPTLDDFLPFAALRRTFAELLQDKPEREE